MKKILLAMVFFLLFVPPGVMAQQPTATSPGSSPMIMEGNKELGLSGSLDFEGSAGGVDIELDALYGYFIRNFLEVGGFVNFSRELDGDVMRYGLGGFAEYHFPVWTQVIPYVGLSLGLQFVDVDFAEDESALVFIPRLGIKWFLREYFSIDTNLFFALATDDIYVNDGDLDPYDIGINLGLRIYFD